MSGGRTGIDPLFWGLGLGFVLIGVGLGSFVWICS